MGGDLVDYGCWMPRCRATALTSTGTCSRRARPNALRRTASSKHSGRGCSHAPRPGIRCPGSGRRCAGVVPRASASVAATTRSSADQLSVPRHPTHVRDGSARSPVRSATEQSNPYAAGLGPRVHPDFRTSRPSETQHARRPAPDREVSLVRCRGAGRVAGSGGLVAGQAGLVTLSVSGRMSMRHPVSLAARRAFCPSLPIARLSW